MRTLPLLTAVVTLVLASPLAWPQDAPPPRGPGDAQPREAPPGRDGPADARPNEPRRPFRDAIRERSRGNAPPDGDAAARGPFDRMDLDPVAMRRRLERRIEEIRHQETLLTDALARLDEGQEPRQVVRELMRRGVGPEAIMQDVRTRVNAPPGDADLRAFVQRTMPLLHEHLERMGPEGDGVAGPAAARVLNQLRPRLEELFRLEKEDPEMYEVKQKELVAGLLVIDASRRISMSYQKWDDATRRSARQRLRATIEANFDARHDVLGKEIRDLEARLAQMHEELEAQNARRDDLIDERTDVIFEQARQGWGAGPEAEETRPRRERKPE